jgi:hypothetical protein
MGISNGANQTSGPGSGSPQQGTEAEQKGGKQPAEEHAERDFQDSPKENGE